MAKLYLIREIAAEKHSQMSAIAEHLGITPTGLSLILKKNNTDVQTLEKIADFLKVSPSVFIDGEYKEALPEPKDPKDLLIESLQKTVTELQRTIENQNKLIELLNK